GCHVRWARVLACDSPRNLFAHALRRPILGPVHSRERGSRGRNVNVLEPPMKLALASGLLLVGLMALNDQTSARGAEPASDFASFVDSYFASRFADRPSEGTAAGLHQYDQKVEDLSREHIERRIGELKDQLATLGKFDRAKLSFDDAIDAEV